MLVRWSVEDVNKMAPDAGSIAAGRKLAQAKQWQLLGASGTHLWGELQGSGAKPYQTCIERAEPAFHCSCPSRKFPCKHGLALAYIYADTPAALSSSAVPAWVEAWAAKRVEREERKQSRSEAASQPVDAEIAARRVKEQVKRAGARLDKARGGIAFVSQWLKDAVRQGLATQAEQPYRYWDELAARTVDAQIPGLARHFKQLPVLRHARAQWQTPFLDSVAHLNLLCNAFERYEELGPEWRADLDAALGMAQGKEDVLAAAAVTDRWCLLGITGGEDEGLRYQRGWLYGQQSGRTAMLLDFAARGQVLPGYGPPGCCFDAEIVFYPSAWPQRALIKQRSEPPDFRGNTQPDRVLPGGVAIMGAAQELYVSAAEKLPWIERIAFTLRAVTPLLHEAGWLVVDQSGDALPLSPECNNAWELLALSGGQAVDLFCEFDGETLLPLSLADARGVSALPSGSGRMEAGRAPAYYPPWRLALTTALLGSERQQQVLMADGPAGEVLVRLYPQGVLPAESETRSRALLNALSMLALYRKAAQPAQHGVALPEPCQADETAPASVVAAGHLRQIIDAKDAALLREWLSLAAASARRCPPVLLPRLLDAAAQNNETDPYLATVLGRRGNWLAGMQEPWRALLAVTQHDTQADAVRDWEEGSSDARRAALHYLRTVEPDAARERLAAVFADEAAAVRAALLAMLSEGLSARDEEFLEGCMSDKSQEVRQRAAELLSQLPGAAFNQRVQARAGSWLLFRSKSGLLSRLGGKKGELEVLLPEVWGAAWTRDGLSEKPPRGKGAKAWWLEQTLSYIAPQHWTQQWNLSAAECLALIEGHEWRDAILGGWLQATLTQRDAEWAIALLDNAGSDKAIAEMRVRLCQVLEPARRERYFIVSLNACRSEALLELLLVLPALGGPWSDALSSAVLKAWRELVSASDAHKDYRAYTLLRDGASQLAPHELPRFENLFAHELDSEGSWNKILNEARERLRFRHAMHAALFNEASTT
jgi:hypothetical protein